MPEQEVIEKAEEVKDTKEWDKEKQRADMEHANFLKAKSEKDALASELGQTKSEIQKLREEIKVNQKKVEIAELDPLRADVPDLVNQNRLLIQRLNQLEESQAQLKSLADEYRTREQKRQAEAERQETIDKICKPLDAEYGAKYRSKAMKMAEDAVAEGKESQPKDAIEAYFLLKKYYGKLKTDDETKKTETKIPTDNGSGAFSFIGKELKEGSLDDVLAQVRKLGRKTG